MRLGSSVRSNSYQVLEASQQDLAALLSAPGLFISGVILLRNPQTNQTRRDTARTVHQVKYVAFGVRDAHHHALTHIALCSQTLPQTLS